MANKLLLIEDVETLGRSGDIVSVRPGYARNFLLPQGFAVVADKNTLRKQKQLQETRRLQAIEDKKTAEEQSSLVQGKVLITVVKVDEAGHMYGSVSPNDVVTMLQNQLNLKIARRAVQLVHPIKQVGVYAIELKLGEGVAGTVTLKVVPEGADAATFGEKKVEEKAAAAPEVAVEG